jgi:hypothetical protein
MVGCIPEHEVTRLEVELLKLASAVLEPLYVFLLEDEQVSEVLLLWRLVLMLVLLPLLAEKLVKELAAAVHQDQAAIVRAVGLVVQKTLYTLHSLALGRLIAVWPGAPCEVFLAWQSDVHAVEGAEELVGAP